MSTLLATPPAEPVPLRRARRSPRSAGTQQPDLASDEAVLKRAEQILLARIL
jgi:hypothetical protein